MTCVAVDSRQDSARRATLPGATDSTQESLSARVGENGDGFRRGRFTAPTRQDRQGPIPHHRRRRLRYRVVPTMLVMQRDAAATAHNIQTHELAYRAGLEAHVLVAMTNVPLAVIFYERLSVLNG